MPVSLDPMLAEVLACPAPDHGRLRAGSHDDPEASALTCTECGRTYPVDGDGIQVMLLDEATPPRS